jgi:hypothetical protein
MARAECGRRSFRVQVKDGIAISTMRTQFGARKVIWDTGAADNFIRPQAVPSGLLRGRTIDEPPFHDSTSSAVGRLPAAHSPLLAPWRSWSARVTVSRKRCAPRRRRFPAGRCLGQAVGRGEGRPPRRLRMSAAWCLDACCLQSADQRQATPSSGFWAAVRTAWRV